MKNSMADLAYQKLKHDVLTCALEPGAQVGQTDLVERYQLGVTPIREALKRLELEGYIQTIPRLGYRVTPLTIEDIRDIYELRLVLEKASVNLAAQRATSHQLSELSRQANFTYRYNDPPSYIEFLSQNSKFHALIAQATGNRLLEASIRRLLDSMTRIFHIGLELRDSAEEMQSEHVALVETIQARDGKAAQALIEEQIIKSQQRVIEMLSKRLHVRSEITF